METFTRMPPSTPVDFVLDKIVLHKPHIYSKDSKKGSVKLTGVKPTVNCIVFEDQM